MKWPRLRAQQDFNQTLLISLSGYGQEEDRRCAAKAGFDYHLVKPVSAGALNALLTLSAIYSKICDTKSHQLS
jgi:CheY-like chemotaxis protein